MEPTEATARIWNLTKFLGACGRKANTQPLKAAATGYVDHCWAMRDLEIAKQSLNELGRIDMYTDWATANDGAHIIGKALFGQALMSYARTIDQTKDRFRKTLDLLPDEPALRQKSTVMINLRHRIYAHHGEPLGRGRNYRVDCITIKESADGFVPQLPIVEVNYLAEHAIWLDELINAANAKASAGLDKYRDMMMAEWDNLLLAHL